MMDRRIKVGVGFGLWSMGVPKPETIVRVAERAEEWGVDSFWLADQIIPRTPDLDVVAVLSLLASRTTTIKLGPSVLLLNLRHPLLVAKAFATLDYLSNGRIVMAVGTGANLAEYGAFGLPTEGRGARLDEGIQALRTLWREPKASFHGRFYNFDNVTLEPRPQPRHNNDFGTIDLWVGGTADGALKRTARFADGYFPSLQTPAEYAKCWATIRRYAEQYGRANARIESGIIIFCRLAPSRQQALEEVPRYLRQFGAVGEQFISRGAFGTPDDIRECIEAYIKVGLNKFVLSPLAGPDEYAGQVETIGREIATPYLKYSPAGER
jgi:probable F420-dependent oxidoreductase